MTVLCWCRFMDGLVNPFKYQRRSSSAVGELPIPDVCLLAKRLKSASSVEVANAWYEAFQQQVRAQSGSSAASSEEVASKRARIERDKAAKDKDQAVVQFSETTHMKLRFASSMHDLERAGLVQMRTNAKQVLLVSKHIYASI
jgi:hypothetical protein